MIKKNYLQKLAIKHLSTRMTIYFSIVIILALLAIASSVSRIFSDKLIIEMSGVVNQKLDLICANLDNSLGYIRTLHFSILNNPSIVSSMQKQSENDPLEDKQIIRIKDELDKYKLRDASIQSIFLIDNDKNILDTLYALPPYNKIITHNSDFRYFIDEGMLGRFSIPTTFPLDILDPTDIQKNTITYFGCYYNTLTYENLGYLAINIRKNSLFSDISSLCDSTFDTTYIIDEKNNIVYHNGSAFPMEIVNNLDSSASYEKPIKIGDLSYLLYTKEVGTYPRWRVIGLLNYEQVTDRITDLYYIVLLISIILLILVIFISFYIAQHITVPIRTISCAMGILGEGKYPEKVAVTTHDELYDLIIGFNNMVDNIKRLNTELITKQEEQKKYEVAIIKSQLDLLQSQINPHFIHNTLNTMNYMAQKAGAAELAQTITSFNALLRTSISQGNHLTTVVEEVENLYNYMNIQKQRYDIPIEFICSVPEEIRFGLVPKMILQPLVENALFHGIAPTRGGTITVSFSHNDNNLYVHVSDTGAGISDEQLKLMLSGSMPNPKGYNNIGLTNVNERLILNYGTGSQLKIFSTLKKGTEISFKIPFIQ